MSSLILISLILVSSSIFIECANLYEGDSCRVNTANYAQRGVCKKIGQCSWALSRIRKRMEVNHCTFSGKTPIVCCPNDNPSIQQRSNKTAAIVRRTYGEISKKKCKEYYPGTFGVYAYGGVPSLVEEFPHMAALGFGSKNDIQWLCGGSLISRKHVLTAAHCLESREYGNVRFARLGDLDLKNTSDVPVPPQDFTIIRAIQHPEYHPKTGKNDIAVLELNKKITWRSAVKPACLHVGNSWEDSHQVTATGWGATEFQGELSSHLIKVFLRIVENAECRQKYSNEGERGAIDERKQICASSRDRFRIQDTCQGDSGGPLQYSNYTKVTHFSIVGVTSFGKPCGITSTPGIYTRVSYYVPWIESMVWGSSTDASI